MPVISNAYIGDNKVIKWYQGKTQCKNVWLGRKMLWGVEDVTVKVDLMSLLVNRILEFNLYNTANTYYNPENFYMCGFVLILKTTNCKYVKFAGNECFASTAVDDDVYDELAAGNYTVYGFSIQWRYRVLYKDNVNFNFEYEKYLYSTTVTFETEQIIRNNETFSNILKFGTYKGFNNDYNIIDGLNPNADLSFNTRTKTFTWATNSAVYLYGASDDASRPSAEEIGPIEGDFTRP